MGGGTAEVDPLLPARRAFASAPSSSKLADLSHQEYATTVATRVVYSRGYGAFYVSLLAASVTEIVWIFRPWTDHCCRSTLPNLSAAHNPEHRSILPSFALQARLPDVASLLCRRVVPHIRCATRDRAAGARRQRAIRLHSTKSDDNARRPCRRHRPSNGVATRCILGAMREPLRRQRVSSLHSLLLRVHGRYRPRARSGLPHPDGRLGRTTPGTPGDGRQEPPLATTFLRDAGNSLRTRLRGRGVLGRVRACVVVCRHAKARPVRGAPHHSLMCVSRRRWMSTSRPRVPRRMEASWAVHEVADSIEVSARTVATLFFAVLV